MISLTAGATGLFLAVAIGFDLGAEATWKLLIAGGAIVILCLVAFGCTRLMRIGVKITDKAIVWELGDALTVYKFGAVDHCEIRSTPAGARTVPVLVVALKNGDREVFGIAPSISTEVLCSTLKQRGVDVVTGAAAPGEPVLSGEVSKSCADIEGAQSDPFQSIVDCLRKDGLSDQANRFDELLHHAAWTTGSEMIGELGLEMKRMWPTIKTRGSDETKKSFRSAARLVRGSWPFFRL